MSHYVKIVDPKHIYYVSKIVMQRKWLNDTFAFNTNSHFEKTAHSDFVIDRATNEFLKMRYVGEQMADALLGIENKDVVKFAAYKNEAQ